MVKRRSRCGRDPRPPRASPNLARTHRLRHPLPSPAEPPCLGVTALTDSPPLARPDAPRPTCLPRAGAAPIAPKPTGPVVPARPTPSGRLARRRAIDRGPPSNSSRTEPLDPSQPDLRSDRIGSIASPVSLHTVRQLAVIVPIPSDDPSTSSGLGSARCRRHSPNRAGCQRSRAHSARPASHPLQEEIGFVVVDIGEVRFGAVRNLKP